MFFTYGATRDLMVKYTQFRQFFLSFIHFQANNLVEHDM